ncbi:hypothetical protein [Gallibacterium salpingitidis]|uniref:hypothetical protein n=1 Tax=Gallibacterium salpingitidis TaxID=505341 RepID=UPI0018D2E661|nr:hypothetical protein [Gallibacterium salpingitidis]
MNINEFVAKLASQEETNLENANEIDDTLPEPVKKLHLAVQSIEGITTVGVNRHMLFDLKSDDFSLPVYADLPLGCLQRTQGGLYDEVLISIDFAINSDKNGLKALEFLSWWVRDLARSGWSVQLRALALPPIAGQLGKTLTFTIDYFYRDPAQDMQQLLDKVLELAESLNAAKQMYLE